MREIDVFQITDAVRQLCIDANMQLSSSLEQKLCRSCAEESSVIGKKVLSDLTENLKAAQELQVPICQDTGMAIILLEIGQDVHFTNGNLNDAVDERRRPPRIFRGTAPLFYRSRPAQARQYKRQHPRRDPYCDYRGETGENYCCPERIRQRKHESDQNVYPLCHRRSD